MLLKQKQGNTIFYSFNENLLDTIDLANAKIIDLKDKITNSHIIGDYKSGDVYGVMVNKNNSISKEFADKIIDIYNNNAVLFVHGGAFANSAFECDTLNIRMDRSYSQYMAIDDSFNGCKIKNINIEVGPNRISSLVNAFRGGKSIVSINITKNGEPYDQQPAVGAGMSGAFEFCENLKTIPMINWFDAGKNIGYAFELCGQLEEIPEGKEENNEIYCNGYLPQVFNWCSKLKKIGPIINLQLSSDDKSGLYLSFNQCKSLSDVKIKGINYMDFDFSGNDNNFYIPNMSLDSAIYLIENAIDVNEQDGHYINFSSNIITEESIKPYVKTANDKGWTIKINNNIIEQ